MSQEHRYPLFRKLTSEPFWIRSEQLLVASPGIAALAAI
jgi:hypothetical protein